MVVMLHGAGQDPADFAAGTMMNEAAERHGFVVLYPGQSKQASAFRCWNWFDPAHQQRGQGEPARIAALTKYVAAENGVDCRRIYVAGLSAGGAMASLLGELYREIYAAVGVHSGLASFAGKDLASGLAAMRGTARPPSVPSEVPTIVFHGDKDTIVSPINGTQVIEAAFGIDRTFTSVEHADEKGLPHHSAALRSARVESRVRRALYPAWRIARVVRWQCRRHLRRSIWPGRKREEAALLQVPTSRRDKADGY